MWGEYIQARRGELGVAKVRRRCSSVRQASADTEIPPRGKLDGHEMETKADNAHFVLSY